MIASCLYAGESVCTKQPIHIYLSRMVVLASDRVQHWERKGKELERLTCYSLRITFSTFAKMRIVERVTLDAEWVIILVDVQIAWSN